MRSIKYRAFYKGEMRQVTALEWIHEDEDLAGCYLTGIDKCVIVNDDETTFGVDLLEFTGLTDRNGVEIYEGDIIKFTYSTGYSTPIVTGVVEFGEYCAGSNDYGDLISLGFYVAQTRLNSHEWNLFDDEIRKGKVIGNIYESPELLEKGES